MRSNRVGGGIAVKDQDHDLEQVRIKAELERHFGDRRQVAKELGISLLTLNRKLRRQRRSPHA